MKENQDRIVGYPANDSVLEPPDMADRASVRACDCVGEPESDVKL